MTPIHRTQGNTKEIKATSRLISHFTTSMTSIINNLLHQFNILHNLYIPCSFVETATNGLYNDLYR